MSSWKGFSVGIFHVSDGRIDFATFVSILEKHSKTEKCQQDIVGAFNAHDRNGTGTVPAAELRHILTQFGDKMSSAEGDGYYGDYIIKILYCRGSVQYRDPLWKLDIILIEGRGYAIDN